MCSVNRMCSVAVLLFRITSIECVPFIFENVSVSTRPKVTHILKLSMKFLIKDVMDRRGGGSVSHVGKFVGVWVNFGR